VKKALWVHFIIKNNKNIIITLNIKLNINHFYNFTVNNFIYFIDNFLIKKIIKFKILLNRKKIKFKKNT